MISEVMISSPISNRAWILPHYLSHIKRIDYPKEKIHLYFLLNNSTDHSSQILREFKKENESNYASISIETFKGKYTFRDDRTTETRMKYTYEHLSNVRNYIFSQLNKGNKKYENITHLFSLDSDILVRPDTLNRLMSHNKEIAAGLIYNGYNTDQENPWRYPNILRRLPNGRFEHIANSYVKNAPVLTESKLVEVGLTGAIILLSRDVCRSTRYSWHEQGEDAGWSIDCFNKGYKLYADYSAFSVHCMNKEILNKYIETKSDKSREN